MSNEEIIQILEKFKDHLSIGNIFTDPFRWLGWIIIKGLAFILDGIEKVTDDMLLIKKFFQNPEVVAFVDTIRPFLFVLLAFSLLYAGYMLIFQKKFDREGMAINIFIAMIVILLLSTGMQKTNEFTDEAIKAINTTELYDEGEGTISENVLSRNIYDLVEFDRNNWSTTELDRPNTIPLDMISGISITEKFDSGRTELDLSKEGTDISKKYIVWTVTQKDLAKFDQSGLDWNNEYYYRYSPDWLTLVTTLAVMAFTLFSISYKLARLSFELAFNYVLAIIIAPADIHDGQKTKKIIQSILNTFLVIILIFLSMKIYMMGTAYISKELEGLSYLIALIAFSVAVIDGPNIVERLFGIDAGLKSGWGLLAGAYAGTKALAGLGKGLANMAKDKEGSEDSKAKSNASKQSKLGNAKAPSPNDEGEENKSTQNASGIAGLQANNGLINKGKGKGSDVTGFSETSTDATGDSGSSTVSKGISSELEEQEARNRTQTKAPSPNDSERAISPQGGTGISPTTSGSNGVQKAQGVQRSTLQTDTDITSVADQARGNTSINNVNTGNVPSPTTVSPTTAHGNTGISPTTSGSNSVDRAQGVQRSTVQTDASITSVADQVQGNTTTSTTNTGTNSPTITSPTSVQGGVGAVSTTSGSRSVEKVTGVQNATVLTETEIASTTERVQGNTTTTTTNTGSSSSVNPVVANVSGGSDVKTTSGSSAVEKNKVVQNATVLTETEIASTTERVQGNTTTTTATIPRANSSNAINTTTERKRPRSYTVDRTSSNPVERMKNFKMKK